MSFVLDASVTLAWIYSDETTAAVHAAFDQIHASSAWVPAIWRLEVANSLRQNMIRRRITQALRDQSLADLNQMRIALDSETNSHAWTDTLVLSDRFRLTVYDACYLELAQRRGLPLATLDQDLRAAGQALGVELLGM